MQRLLRRPIVLAYHRVASLERDPFLLAVRPAHFAEQLDVLARVTRPTPLAALAEDVAGGARARAAVALTFDDGYVDNLTTALPLLAAADTPATVFVTSGAPGGAHWWDELERLVLAPDALPGSLELAVDGESHAWTLGEASTRSSNGSWSIRSAADSPREKLFRELSELLRRLDPQRRGEVLAALVSWSTTASPWTPENRCLTAEEISELGGHDLVEIGAHTVSHPVLSLLLPERQRLEIEESRRFVTTVVGLSPTSFAYPFGGAGDYDAVTVDLVRETRFACAVTTRPGILRRDDDPYQLPRFLVRDWGGDEFERRIRGLLYG